MITIDLVCTECNEKNPKAEIGDISNCEKCDNFAWEIVATSDPNIDLKYLDTDILTASEQDVEVYLLLSEVDGMWSTTIDDAVERLAGQGDFTEFALDMFEGTYPELPSRIINAEIATDIYRDQYIVSIDDSMWWWR